jgi:ribosomal protein L37E
MKILTQLLAATALITPFSTAHAAPPAELCKALRGFVESVQPDDKREVAFHTSWGSNFKDAQESAISAKRCTHNSYEPAKAVCAYLMEHGYTEFADINVKNSISCLSKKTKFAPMLSLNGGEFSFSYGSDNKGALIDITFKEDPEIGGMVFRVVADGY